MIDAAAGGGRTFANPFAVSGDEMRAFDLCGLTESSGFRFERFSRAIRAARHARHFVTGD
jgi:hypothetical protein